MKNHYYAVIMAGGSGTRLWPLSRQQRPKQMLPIFDDLTLFQVAVNRLDGLFAPDHIYVVTAKSQAAELQRECPQIPTENYLLEPLPRGTASVVGMGAVALLQRDPEAVMAVLTADHFIENIPVFQNLLKEGFDLAQKKFLVTLGIKPTFASTGYGYIHRGAPLEARGTYPAFLVESFREKPNEAAARQFVDSGEYDWNSGMFIWRADRVMEEFARQMPELSAILSQIADAWKTPEKESVLNAVWPTIRPQTIDYGVMEHATQTAVLPAGGLGWNDVGSWDALFDVLPTDENGNIVLSANHIGLNSSHTLVCSEQKKRLVVTIGVQNLIVIETGDALLVCDRSQAQSVKEAVTRLKQTGQEEYL
ncbi:MAG TPA: sugar phosphate nucleotidyltransferase [Anaerolineaceae bacterium]|nr:sugar phosphate nucleotidyltransferase [Anaerolineaceae bacterium]HPN51063.1 sugar phosphate nucleotidyltransferase [Anaerolineaceae bacterium]